MKTWSLRASRTLIAATAATLIGLAAAACTTGTPSAGSAPTTPSQAPPPTSASLSYAPVLSPTPITTPAAALKFPNTDFTVLFTGYDGNKELVEFKKVVQDPQSRGAHLVPDPADPATHRLPMAKDANVKSIDPNGFPFETCPPTGCSGYKIMESVIGHFNNAFYAHIHVNAADQIDSANQSAY
jgi:hypothetical protein